MKRGILSGNALKILALITMTFDHIGFYLLQNYEPFRILGRLSFPLFAYMIAEGCRYTKNKKKHLCGILGLGILCQLVFFIAERSLYQSILITFSMSIVLIYVKQWVMGQEKKSAWVLWELAIAMAFVICEVLPKVLVGTDFCVDYGFFGVMLPVWISLSTKRKQQWCLAAIGILLLSLSMGGLQWYSLGALPILALYDGTRGKWKIKYLFYCYYPLHLVVIYGISLFC